MASARGAATSFYAAFSSLTNASFNTRPSSRLCAQCLRQHRRQSIPLQATRRSLATAHAQRPEPFEPEVPPRNANVPDTSITSRFPAQLPQHDGASPSTTNAPNSQNISIPEVEAQKSKQLNANNAGSVASPQPSPIQDKPRKSKLRPRKAAMTLSPSAVSQLRGLLDQPNPKLIRVGVKNRGCSGLAYHLEYVEKPGAFDEAVDQDGVKVLIDSKALFSIIGSEMDWIEDKLSRRFVFKNPNITEQCGCGESFSIG